MNKASIPFKIQLVSLMVFLLLASPTAAQPSLPKFYSFSLYFTLPPELEAQFEFGDIDIKDLNIDCQYYYNTVTYQANKEFQTIFFHRATFEAPAQIRIEDGFELLGGNVEFDSIAVHFQWNGKKYATTVLPALNKLRFGCICDFKNEYKRLAPNICKTQTLYVTGRPDSKTLKRIIAQNKSKAKLKRRKPLPNAQLLKIVNSDLKPLYPLVIANGDTCQITELQGIDAIVLPFPWENQKIQLKIFHPDYPSLILDSVSRSGHGGLRDYVYLLREEESYFLDGGIRLPLKNGYKELAFWFDPSISDSALAKIVQRLTTRHKLKLTKDWKKLLQLERDSLGSEYVESKYGSFEGHLEHVLHFQLEQEIDFNYNHIPRYAEEINDVSIPLSFYQYLDPVLTVQFKSGLSKEEVESFEKEYLPNFKRTNYDSAQTEINLIQRTYQFPDWLFVPNYFQEVIMRDSRVRYCGGTEYKYILTD
mgnify:FL=1